MLAREIIKLEKAYALAQDLDFVRTNHTFKSYDFKASVSKPSSSPQPNRSSTLTHSHRNDIRGKSLERNNKNKGSEFPKVSFTIKCYKCQCNGHLSANCPSLVGITIIDGTRTEATESDSEEYICGLGDAKTYEEFTSDDVGLNCINQTLSTHLFVVRCVPSQPAEKDDWRKSATYYMFTKIRDKSCKVIVDSENCINVILSKSLENLGIKAVLHPHPFKVS